MKKILLVGAAGSIGTETAKALLKKDEYEITLLDLKNNNTSKKLKKFKNKCNVIYTNENDLVLYEKLVLTHDIIIFMATVMPPLSNIKKDLAHLVEYQTLDLLIRAINYYNPKCSLIYLSDTTIYKDNINPNLKTKIKLDKNDYYAYNKYKCEKEIVNKLDNYTILRLPLVLTKIENSNYMYLVNKKEKISCITDIDCANLLEMIVKNIKEYNKKTYNIGAGKKFEISYNELINHIIRYHGINLQMVLNNVFMPKNYFSPVISDCLDKSFSTDTLENYYTRVKYSGRRRIIQKVFGKIYLFFKERRK